MRVPRPRLSAAIWAGAILRNILCPPVPRNAVDNVLPADLRMPKRWWGTEMRRMPVGHMRRDPSREGRPWRIHPAAGKSGAVRPEKGAPGACLLPAGHKRRGFCKTAAERPVSPTLSPDASAALPGKGRLRAGRGGSPFSSHAGASSRRPRTEPPYGNGRWNETV